jgi:hypothetical protein
MPAELLANRMQWLIRLCVIPFMCLLCGGLVCTDLSDNVVEFVSHTHTHTHTHTHIYIYIYII